MSELAKHNRDLFEIHNARNLSRDELVATFVPTAQFDRLLSPQNHVILGSRGSGKTALAKALSHDHLCRLKYPKARLAVEARSFVGIYIPARVEWVGGLTNKPWLNAGDAEQLFIWRLNLAACESLLNTIRSCLDFYEHDLGKRTRIERDLAHGIAAEWQIDSTVDTLARLNKSLDTIDYSHQQYLARARVFGSTAVTSFEQASVFYADLFRPLRRAITLTKEVVAFSEDCVWALCIDEAEFLDTAQHQLLNTYMRAFSGDLIFKITTMPYSHHTLQTNMGVPLNVGHDFEYVYIDHDPLSASGSTARSRTFAKKIFQKRVRASGSKYRHLKLLDLLGQSELLDPSVGEWGSTSPMFDLLRQYGSRETVARGERLASHPKDFQNQIARKMSGALLLRDAVERTKGRGELDVYSGDLMAIRCSDANPRRLIRIFNSFLRKLNERENTSSVKGENQRISRKEQSRLLIELSASSLSWVQSEPQVGLRLYKFLVHLGEYMQSAFYQRRLTTDQIGSVQIDEGVPEDYWTLVKAAAALGLLYPNVGSANPDQMPEREGPFRLAYILAPHFRLLPRRGKARHLNTILAWESISPTSPDGGQAMLFD